MSADPQLASWRDLSLAAKANTAALAVLAIALCLFLLPGWTGDPDISHGLLMPFVFILLLWQSRSSGPRRFLHGGPRTTAAAAGLAGAALAVFILGGIYAAALEWTNALVAVLLATSLSLVLGAALVTFADERVRWIPFNWTSLVAVALWPLCSPMPPGTYSRLTDALQLGISHSVVHTLHLLGILADGRGNVILLAHATVGVEEACSGVRSLVSCVFVGFFLSASLLSRWPSRLFLIAVSAPLALGMNFVRSLTLTLLANSGVSISGFWHDMTGYAVLALTSALMAGLALFLGRGARNRPAGDEHASPNGEFSPTRRPRAAQALLSAALAALCGLWAFFYLNCRPSSLPDPSAPDLWAVIPDAPPGWAVTATPDLYQFSGVLQTKALAQRIYRRDGPRGPAEVIIYAAYWSPGQAPVSLVETHTPDACWPGTGWAPLPLPQSREALEAGGRTLPPAECRLFSGNGEPQYIWFWHFYDGQLVRYINPYSLKRLLHIALSYGFQHDGPQLFVRISSNRPWSELQDDPLMTQFFARTLQLGL